MIDQHILTTKKDYPCVSIAIKREVLKLEGVNGIAGTYNLKKNVKILEQLFLINNGNTRLKKRIREVLEVQNKDNQIITFDNLREAHWNISQMLNCEYRDTKRRTASEPWFSDIIAKKDRHKVFFGFWIMNHCVDIFYPQFKIIIEIDGAIHNIEAKMRKDECRDKNIMCISDLGIPIWSVQNQDVPQRAHKFSKHIKGHKRLCSRTVKNLLRRIYIYTIARHWNLEQLSKFFKIDFIKLNEEIFELNGKKVRK